MDIVIKFLIDALYERLFSKDAKKRRIKNEYKDKLKEIDNAVNSNVGDIGRITHNVLDKSGL